MGKVNESIINTLAADNDRLRAAAESPSLSPVRDTTVGVGWRSGPEVAKLKAERAEAIVEAGRLEGAIRQFLRRCAPGGARPSDLRDDLMNALVDELAAAIRPAMGALEDDTDGE